MQATIKATFADLKKHGIEPSHLILVAKLGQYGFTDRIVADMVRLDIFPPVYLVAGALYVERAQIFGIVQNFLENAIRLYDTVEATEAKKAAVGEAIKQLEASAVKLTPEVVRQVIDGDVDLRDILAANDEGAEVEVAHANGG